MEGEFTDLQVQNGAVSLQRGQTEVVRVVRASRRPASQDRMFGASETGHPEDDPIRPMADGSEAVTSGGIVRRENIGGDSFATDSFDENTRSQAESVGDALRGFDDEASTFPPLHIGKSASAKPVSEVAFVLGSAWFIPGDNIEIESVTSDGDGLAIGSTVTVTGTYTLSSARTAKLCFYSTVTLQPWGDLVATPVRPTQRMDAVEGTHSFTLSKVIRSNGSPHISFYNPTTGQGMGGVYFAEQIASKELSAKPASPKDTFGIDENTTTGNLLSGTWEIELFSPLKNKRSGFAAFAGNAGMIAAGDDETAPMRFTYVIRPHAQQLWIDFLAADGAPDGGPSRWQGIVEASQSSIALCFAREDQVEKHGRPVNIESADPSVFVKVVFTAKTAGS